MVILRRIFLVIALAALAGFLWALAIDVGVVHFVENPSRVKQVLADSGIYKNVVATVLDQTKDLQINGYDVPAGNSLVKNAANQAFPPDLIQKDVNTVVDSITDWLNGQTLQPEFRIDLSAPKADFAKDLASSVQTNLASLPACTAASSASLVSFNPFTATCLPAGIDPATIASQVQSDVVNGDSFLAQTTYTANDIKTSDGKPVFEQGRLNSGPSRYQRVKSSPYAIGLIALLLAVAVIFLSPSRRKGLRRVGITLVIIGMLVLLVTWVINSASNKVNSLGSDIQNKALQTSVDDALKSFVHDLAHVYYILGSAYLALGLLAILVSILAGKASSERRHDEPTHTNHKPAEPVMHEPEVDGKPDKEEHSLSEPAHEPQPEPEKHTHTPTRRKIDIS